MTMRVLIVDDHAVLSHSLAHALSLQGIDNVRVAAPHELGEEALLALVHAWRPAVVLLDLYLGGGQVSVPMVPALRTTGATVVILTASEDRAVWAEALEAGAAGVLSKSVDFDDLVAAVKRAGAGQPVISDKKQAELLEELARARETDRTRLARFQRLSPREQQVLAGLIDGQAAKQIAAQLGVTLPTVRTQIRGLFEKLGVNSQRAAVALALREGWKPEELQ